MPDLAETSIPGLLVVDQGAFVPWDGMTPAARARWLSRAGAARRAAVALGMTLADERTVVPAPPRERRP